MEAKTPPVNPLHVLPVLDFHAIAVDDSLQ